MHKNILVTIISLFTLSLILSFVVVHQHIDLINNQLKQVEKENIMLKKENQELQNKLSDEKEKLDRVLTLSGKTKEELCQVVMSETRGGGIESAMAVMQTVLDRSRCWDMTASEVIRAPGQYARPTIEPDKTVELAFELVYIDGYRVFQEPTTHFYNPEKCDPSWKKIKVSRGVVGGHRFMY